MQKPLRVGIISANWGVIAHLPAWRSLEGVEVKAICTSRPETAREAAEKYGIDQAYHDFREMAAAPDLDVIDVGTRPGLRYHMVKAALENGKHVYNGIPFAVSLDHARDMVRMREQAGATAAVDAFSQAIPAFVYLKELIDEGYLGDLFGVRVSVDLAMFTQSRTNVPTYVWFGDPENGTSAMRNNGSHILHLLVHLFGPAASVMSEQSSRLGQWQVEGGDPITPQVPDTAFAIVNFASGLPAQISASWSIIDGEGFKLEVWGSKRRIVASSPMTPQAFSTRLFVSEDGPFGVSTQQELPVPERLKTFPGCNLHADTPRTGVFPMATIFQSMRREIEGTGKAAPSFEQALHVQEVVEAAEISSKEGRRVMLSEMVTQAAWTGKGNNHAFSALNSQ